jgi:hypothetical protein
MFCISLALTTSHKCMQDHQKSLDGRELTFPLHRHRKILISTGPTCAHLSCSVAFSAATLCARPETGSQSLCATYGGQSAVPKSSVACE